MTVVVMMFLGAGFGVGVLLVAAALRPEAQPIREVFRSVSQPGQVYAESVQTSGTSVRQLAISAGTGLALASNDETQLRKDLAVTGSTLEQHGLVKSATPAFSLLAVYLLWLLLAAVGLVINPLWATIIALGGALIAFVVPDVRLRARAKERRTAFRHALSAYLDLVTIIMSGGGGLLTALHSAADAGDGWAFAEIRERSTGLGSRIAPRGLSSKCLASDSTSPNCETSSRPQNWPEPRGRVSPSRWPPRATCSGPAFRPRLSRPPSP